MSAARATSCTASIGITVLIGVGACRQPGIAPADGPYLGQALPGMHPELFAPGLVTTPYHEHSSPAFSPDGKEVYWSVFLNFWGPQAILRMRQVDGQWTPPEVAPFSGQYSDGNPCFSADGRKLYFESRRPVRAGDAYSGETDLWVVERATGGWGEPRHLGWVVNSERWERGPCVSADGSLYFCSLREGGFGGSDIYRAAWVDGAFAAPENLGSTVNTAGHESFPYVTPDESLLLYESASGDLFAHTRLPDGSWSEAIDMAEALDSSGPQDRFPRLSDDGTVLFFVSNRWLGPPFPDSRLTLDRLEERARSISNGMGNVFWVDARILDELRPAPDSAGN
jgi:Tol biopolymer transport system component